MFLLKWTDLTFIFIVTFNTNKAQLDPLGSGDDLTLLTTRTLFHLGDKRLPSAFQTQCQNHTFKDSCQPFSLFPLSPLTAAQSACPSHPQQREAFQFIPYSPLPAFSTTKGLRPSVCLFCDGGPEGALCISLLPPSIPLSHTPWSIWTQREWRDLSVKADGGKWSLRWRRHALYIKCPDPCEGWRQRSFGVGKYQ